MKDETKNVIQRCLKFQGGRSRCDKSFPFILPLIEKFKPSTIIDIGCGRGSAAWIIQTEFPTMPLDMIGYDIFPDYLKDVNASGRYRQVTCVDVRNYKSWDLFPPRTMVLAVDVLEHMEREQAIALVKQWKADGLYVVASIPNSEKHWHQSPEYERKNPHEAHLFDWTNDAVALDLGLDLVGEFDGVGVYHSTFVVIPTPPT